jgi:Ca2+-binding EF-hand superfamily protein
MCTSLTELDLSYNKLRGVDGLPPTLLKLDISNNMINGDMNLRMLSFVPKLTSLAVEGNPVMSKFKNPNAHLLTLIPKLEVINYHVLPRAGHGHKVSSAAATALSMRKRDRGRSRNRQSMSSATSSRSKASHKRLSLSPTKKRKSEQQAHVLALATSNEGANKAREKLLQAQDEAARKMAKKTANKVFTPAKLEESTNRMNSWKPNYLKRLEQEEIREAEEKARQQERKRQKEELLSLTPRKTIFGLRSGLSRSRSRSPGSMSRSKSPLGRSKRSTEKLYGPIARESLCAWMTHMQVIMSDAYTQVCNLVDTVCTEADTLNNTRMTDSPNLRKSLKDRQADISRSQRRGTFFGMYQHDQIPEGPSALDVLKKEYAKEFFALLEDIRLNPVPNADVDEDIVDDTVNWHEDVQNCNTVLAFIHACLTWQGLELDSFKDLVKTLITYLQRDSNGLPLEFVAWGHCAEKCRKMNERGLDESDVIVSSTYSPIHGLKDDSDLLLISDVEEKENNNNNNNNNFMDFRDNDDNEEYHEDYVDNFRNQERNVSDVTSVQGVRNVHGSSRLSDNDVDIRMNGMRNRIMQRSQLEGSMIPSYYVPQEENETSHHDAPFHIPAVAEHHPGKGVTEHADSFSQAEYLSPQGQEVSLSQPDHNLIRSGSVNKLFDTIEGTTATNKVDVVSPRQSQSTLVASSPPKPMVVSTPPSAVRTAAVETESEINEGMMAHPSARLFHLIDRNGDGQLTLTEFIVALRQQPRVAMALKLPHVVKQEDGSRDQCVLVFNAMDDDNAGSIDLRKFLSYMDKINGPLEIVDGNTQISEALTDVVETESEDDEFEESVVSDDDDDVQKESELHCEHMTTDVAVQNEKDFREEISEPQSDANKVSLDVIPDVAPVPVLSEDLHQPSYSVNVANRVSEDAQVVSAKSSVSTLTDTPVDEPKTAQTKKAPFGRSDSMKREDDSAANLFSKMDSLKAKIFSTSPPTSPARVSLAKSQSLSLPTRPVLPKTMSLHDSVPVSEAPARNNDLVLPTVGTVLPTAGSVNHTDPVNTHSHAHLFRMMDRNGDGELSLTEFIVALRGHPEVSAALNLPQVIRQEDGSRDKCVSAFNDMDVDNSNYVDIRKFLRYYDKVHGLGGDSDSDDASQSSGSADNNMIEEAGESDEEDESGDEVIDTPFLSGLMNRSYSSGSIDSRDSAPSRSSVTSSVASTASAMDRLKAKIAANKNKKK